MSSKVITRTRGNTLVPIQITVVDENTNEPIDVTGNTFLLTVNTLKDPPDNTTEVFQITGVVVPDQVNNKGEVEFTPSTSDADNLGRFFFDIELTSATKPHTPIKGSYNVNQKITQ